MSKKKGTIYIWTGVVLIASSLVLVASNLWTEHSAGDRSKQVTVKLIEMIPEENGNQYSETQSEDVEIEYPDYILNPNMEMPVQEIDGAQYIGVLKIPRLNLELPIQSTWSYPGMKISPCRYEGSIYLDNLVICGHNYITHFGSLKELEPGDQVSFADMDGNKFDYVVMETEILQPTAVDEMTSGNWDLSLFTCTIGGATRVTVRCQNSK